MATPVHITLNINKVHKIFFSVTVLIQKNTF